MLEVLLKHGVNVDEKNVRFVFKCEYLDVGVSVGMSLWVWVWVRL